MLFRLSRVLVGAKWPEELFVSVAATRETPFLWVWLVFFFFQKRSCWDVLAISLSPDNPFGILPFSGYSFVTPEI